MNFYIFLSIISAIYFLVALLEARKYPAKSEFAAAYFFTLVTFFVSAEKHKNTLMFMLTTLTLYSIYIIFKKEKATGDDIQ